MTIGRHHMIIIIIIICVLLLSSTTTITGKTLDYRIKNEETDTTLSYTANSTNYYAWRLLNSTSLQAIPISANINIKLEAIAVRLYLSVYYDMEENRDVLVFVNDVKDADNWAITKSSSIYLIHHVNLQKYLCVALNSNMSNFEDRAVEPRCHWKIRDVMLEERTVALVVFITFGIVIVAIITMFGLYYILKRYTGNNEYEEIQDQYSRKKSSVTRRSSIGY